ncbi:MAG TPA: hypothetical protein VLC50_04425 [Actinomycetes bacterium]|nr:hypothetical protein [Actinomycetes bacterium]
MHLSYVASRPIVAGPPTVVNVVLRHVVAVAAAISAGVHVALVPDHWAEGGPTLGLAFAVAGVAAGAVALFVRRPEHDVWAPLAAAIVLAATVLAYALSRTVGVPWLISEPEGLDPLGVLTTVAELFGAVSGLLLTTRKDPA